MYHPIGVFANLWNAGYTAHITMKADFLRFFRVAN